MTDKKLRSVVSDTACGVVRGLYVRPRRLGDGSVVRYFILRDKKSGRSWQLGKYPELSLSDAFAKAAEWRAKIDAGIDPAAELKAKQEALKASEDEQPDATVKDVVYGWIRFNEERGRWKNALKPKELVWDGFCRNHLSAELMALPAKDLTAERLYVELGEKWWTMIDTPERILSDMRNAFDWAMRQELIPLMLNPAKVKDGRLGDLLALDRPEGGHEPALPPRRMPLFFAELMKYVPVSQTARCIAFAILTSARNTTAREATWDEIQKDENGHYLHVIPRERMKVKSEKIPFDRKTPLSAQAVAILKGAPRFEGDEKGFIFPNINKGKLSAFSRDSFRAFLKRMHVKQKKVDGIGWIDPDQKTRDGQPRIVTLHGLARATFNTWAKDAKGYGHKPFPRDLRESCLDHRNESYQCAYDREQALGDMREVYDAWGEFCWSEMKGKIQLFEDHQVRSAWDDQKEEWLFSVVDVVRVLSGSSEPKRYWSALKRKLKKEGATQTYENIVRLKMTAPDGKGRLTDAASIEQILRIIQSIPSPKDALSKSKDNALIA